MARPTNSIANVKLPGENTQRPIVPYAVGVNTNNSCQATLPELTADDYIAVSHMIAAEYDPERTQIYNRYIKGEYCVYQGYLYRAKATTYGTWDSTKWDKISLAYQLDLLQYGIYYPGTYGYSRSTSSSIATVGTSLRITEASDHTDSMMTFYSREGTSSYNIYTTTIYPGRITLNGDDVATVLQVPSSFEWTNGTTAGPTGSLKNSLGTELVSFAAIPNASASQSGVVTTGSQTFAGNKTFNGNISTSGTLTISSGTGLSTITTIYSVSNISRSTGSHGTLYTYAYPDRSGTLGLQIDIVDLTELTE